VHSRVILFLPSGREALGDALGLGVAAATDGQTEDERQHGNYGSGWECTVGEASPSLESEISRHGAREATVQPP
jgi:hypothetical protein